MRLFLSLAVGGLLAGLPAASLQTLYAFHGAPDGKAPESGLVRIGGELYGTSYFGGASGAGTVYKIDRKGREHVIYSFKGGADGANPFGPLSEIGGVLFGTTELGGAGASGGNGTVFGLTTSGRKRFTYAFQGGADGALPFGGMAVLDGTLYGTTETGGAHAAGTVFAITPSGSERVLYAFRDQPDGAAPLAGLIAVDGVLYGTTAGGGTLDGTVFSVTTSGVEQILHTFRGNQDGETPAAPLLYLDGELYGTTVYGGSIPSDSYGTVFKVDLNGNERIVHRFKGSGHADGAAPQSALVAIGKTLYGTTVFGGAFQPSGRGSGTVYSVTESGIEKIVYDFTAGADGANPIAELLPIGGRLYGTTSGQGLSGPSGNGTVFALTP